MPDTVPSGSEPPTPNDLPEPVRDLIAAVVDALDIPLPSTDAADERAYHRVLALRTTDVRIMLATLLDFPDVAIDKDPAALRARTAAVPVTYGVYEDVQDGGQR